MRIFLSYARRDLDRATILASDLRAMGHEVWLDRELSGGREWWEHILAEIRQADLFILAATPFSVASAACRAELHYASELRKNCIPVTLSRLGAHRIPDELQAVQLIEYDRLEKAQALALAKALNMLGEPPAAPLPLPEPPAPPKSVHQIELQPSNGFTTFQQHWLEASTPGQRLLGPAISEPGVQVAHVGSIHIIVVSPDSRWLYTEAAGSGKIWDLIEGGCRSQFEVTERAHDAAFIHGLDALARVTRRGCVINRISDGAILGELTLADGGPDSTIGIARFAPGAEIIGVGSWTERMFALPDSIETSYGSCKTAIWSVITATRLAQFDEPDRPVTGIAVDASGERVLSYTNKLRMHSIYSDRPAPLFPGDGLDSLRASGLFAFSPTGTLFATGGTTHDDVLATIWHTHTLQPVRTLNGREAPSQVMFSQNGRSLVTVGTTATTARVRLWELHSDRLIADVQLGERVSAACVTPDGCYVLAGTTGGLIMCRRLVRPHTESDEDSGTSGHVT